MKILMRATFFSMLIAMLFFQSCSQKEKHYRLHIFHYINAAGETGKTTYKYDNSDLNFGARWELMDGSRWSANYHTYDANGNMVLKYREFSDSLISHNWYTYNEKNQLIKEKFFRSDSINGLTYYKYDGDKLIAMDCQGFNGWFHGLIEMIYDENGLKTGANISKDGNKIGKIAYTYENELLIKEYWEFDQGFTQTLTYEYEEYTDAERIKFTSSNVYLTNTYDYYAELEEYYYNNEGGGPSYFEYDEDGKLLKKTFVRADGLKTTTDFFYKENGHLLKSIRNYNSGDIGVFNYKFNGNGLLEEKNFMLPDSLIGYEKYTYNGKFQLKKAELLNFDNWITGTIEYEYDEDGKLKLGHFKGDRFNAEIEFTVDDKNNIITYHWNMSFGATQTYKFTYKKFD